MTSPSMEAQIRSHLKDHEAFCEPHCECVDIRLLRAALDRIEEWKKKFFAEQQECVVFARAVNDAEAELSHLRAENARLKDDLQDANVRADANWEAVEISGAGDVIATVQVLKQDLCHLRAENARLEKRLAERAGEER